MNPIWLILFPLGWNSTTNRIFVGENFPIHPNLPSRDIRALPGEDSKVWNLAGGRSISLPVEAAWPWATTNHGNWWKKLGGIWGWYWNITTCRWWFQMFFLMCSPLFWGKISNLTSFFFRWVETTNQKWFLLLQVIMVVFFSACSNNLCQKWKKPNYMSAV